MVHEAAAAWKLVEVIIAERDRATVDAVIASLGDPDTEPSTSASSASGGSGRERTGGRAGEGIAYRLSPRPEHGIELAAFGGTQGQVLFGRRPRAQEDGAQLMRDYGSRITLMAVVA
jgi:hypothetical protein